MSDHPKTSILRVTQPSIPTEDKREGGGQRKMFRGVRQRLATVAAELPLTVNEFRATYREEKAPLPYLVLRIEPSAIAKSHSARKVLENLGICVVATRRLDERIIHGSDSAFGNLTRTVLSAVDHAPTEEDFEGWTKQEKEAREKAKLEGERTGGKVTPERVRRNLRRGDMLWNEVAQLSTFEKVALIRPADKLCFQNQEWFDSARAAIVTTFPPYSQLGESIATWANEIEAVAASHGVKRIHVLRSDEDVLAEVGGCVAGRPMWSMAGARARTKSYGRSVILLAESGRDGGLTSFAGLSFIHSLEPAQMTLSATTAKDSRAVAEPRAPRPIAGLADTGIQQGTPLEPFILERRGSADVRKKKHPHAGHARQVGEIMTADAGIFPWLNGSPGEKCALIDVATFDGTRLVPDSEWVAAVTEGTLHRDDEGVVNVSVNNVSGTRTRPAPKVSTLGEALDEQSLNSDILLIVNSAGNTGCIGMDPPSDGVHVVSVGAILKTKDGRFERCSYSCYGGGIAHNVKPTFVVPLKDEKTPGEDDTWRTQGDYRGTSFGTPVVSRLSANLRHRGYRRDEALVLMVHNAVQPGQDISYQPSMADLEKFGFGLPPSIEECDPPDAQRFTLLYREPEARKGFVRTLTLPVPEELRKYKAFVRLTAYSRAPISELAGEEYVACEVPAKLRMLRRKKMTTIHVDLPPEPSDYAQRYEKHRIRYGWKWSTLRRFSKEIHFEDFKEFQLRIGPVTWRDWAADESAGNSVDVQCALTFYPTDPDAPGFFELFRSAFARQKIKFEIPIEIELRARAEAQG